MSTELPTFLVQTAPGRYTLTFSASGAETASLCWMKYQWAYLARIEAAVARAGQNFGEGLHLALAHRYSHMELSLAQAEAEGIEIIQAHFAENPQPALGSKGRPEWRTATRAAQAFRTYNERYPAEDFEVLGVEEPFEVVLGEFEASAWQEGSGGFREERPASVTVLFRGIRDLRVRWHDQLWVLDHKTSQEWSDLKVDEGKCSFQFQGYAWVERALAKDAARCPKCGYTKEDAAYHMDHVAKYCDGVIPSALPVGGVIGNYIISREPYASETRKPKPNDLPRDQFERVPYPYSDTQLDEWHERAMGIAREIFRHWREEEWPQNSTACAHWGKCEYYKLCWETEPAYRMAAAMGADFRERRPSPFEEAENGKRD